MGEDGRLLFSSSYKQSKHTIVYVNLVNETSRNGKKNITPPLIDTTCLFTSLLTYINN